MFLPLSALLLASQASAYYHLLPVIPGVGNLGQSFFLLNPSKPVGNQLLQMTFSRNLTTPLQDHKLPDGLLYSENKRCFFSPSTRVANNVKDFQQRYADKYRVGGGSYSLVESFNEDVRWAYGQMERYNRSVSYSEIACTLYNLQVNNAINGNVKLQEWFVSEIENLPGSLDGSNLQRYLSFFDKYGDHVYTKCSVGGVITQFLATDYAYWSKKSIQEVKCQSERAFMVGVEESKKPRFPVDPKFRDASTIRPYKYFGGVFPESSDNWNDWSSSILMGENLVCASWEAEPITELLPLDHRTLSKKSLMETALSLYLRKPACNHIKFSDKLPANTIMKISDVHNCDAEVKGAWWLVSGASEQDECLVSWAFVEGTNNRVVGQTQHLRTDFTKVGTCLKGVIRRDSSNCSY